MDFLAQSLSLFLKNPSRLIVLFSRSNVDMTAKPLPELSGDFRITVRAIPLAIFSANYAQNQTIPAFVSARNSRQKINWARLSRIKAAVTVTIQICLDMFLEMFGLVDFVVTVVIPLFIAVLRYRYDEQDASAEMDDLSTEANKVGLLQCYRNILTDGWYRFQSWSKVDRALRSDRKTTRTSCISIRDSLLHRMFVCPFCLE